MNLLTQSDLTRAARILRERAKQVERERIAARWPAVQRHCQAIRDSMVRHNGVGAEWLEPFL